MTVRGLALVCIVAIVLGGWPSAAASPPGTVAHLELAPSVVLLAWTAADPAPDFYRVYGLDESDAPTLLAETTNLTALVEGDFAGYAVSSVFDDEEGVATPSQTGHCIVIDPSATPPVQIVECPPEPTTSTFAIPLGGAVTWLLDMAGP